MAVFSIACTAWAAESVTLRWFVAPNASFNEGQRAIIEAYERRNPNVKVELVIAPSGSYADQILTQVVSGQLPDLVYNVHQQTASLLEAGHFVDLTELAARDPEMPALIESLIPGAWEFTKHGEQRFFLPMTVAIRIGYFNKDHFLEAGLPFPTDDWTWDEFLDYARELTKRDADGKVLRWGMGNIPGDEIWLMHWVYQAGGRYFDNQYMPTESWVTRPNTLEAMRFVHALRWEHNVSPRPGDPFVGTAGFVNNAVSMWIENPARIANFAPVENLSWDIRRLPQYRERASSSTDDGIFINSRTPHLEEAWDFVKFTVTPEAQALFAVYAHVPISREVALSEEWLSYPVPDLNKVAFFYEAAVAYPRVMTPKYEQDYQRIFREEWNKAFNLNQVPVETAAAAIHERLTQLLAGR